MSLNISDFFLLGSFTTFWKNCLKRPFFLVENFPGGIFSGDI